MLNVHVDTLRRWSRLGHIRYSRTPGGHRLYDPISVTTLIEGQDGCHPEIEGHKEGASIVYCRVNSAKQKDDLQRQKETLQERFPAHEVITDIGSGINLQRRGLLALLDRICTGTVREVVVAHWDRLARFGFELIEWLCQRHGTRLVVLQHVESTPQGEFVEDLLAIIHVFSCRFHGLRRYQKRIEKEQEGAAVPQPGAAAAAH